MVRYVRNMVSNMVSQLITSPTQTVVSRHCGKILIEMVPKFCAEFQCRIGHLRVVGTCDWRTGLIMIAMVCTMSDLRTILENVHAILVVEMCIETVETVEVDYHGI